MNLKMNTLSSLAEWEARLEARLHPSASGRLRRGMAEKVVARNIKRGLLFSEQDSDLIREPLKIDTKGYAYGEYRTRERMRQVRIARVVMRRMIGREFLPGEIVDHIDGDWQDNRLENLRFLCPNCHAQTATWCRQKRTSATSRIVEGL